MKKRLKVTLIMIITLVMILVGAFFIYVSDYYRADDVAIAAMQNKATIRVEDNLIILSPTTPGDTALIFYPGAKVEYFAYLPILEKIEQTCGITCILVKMPFNMAIFDANAADKIIDLFPDIKNWYMPSAYWLSKGLNSAAKPPDNPYAWVADTVVDILGKKEYLGHTVNFKTCRKSYKSKKKVRNTDEDQIVFERACGEAKGDHTGADPDEELYRLFSVFMRIM